MATPVNGVYAPPVVVQANDYDMIGLEIGINKKGSNNYLFQKQERISDFDLDIDFFKFRPSDSKNGRFWQIDPLAEKWNMVSPYTFCLNNPVKHIDPDGRDVITAIKTNSNSSTYASKSVKYTVTMTVVNLSGADLSKTMFNQSAGSVRLGSFSGSGSFSYPSAKTGKKDIDYNIEANVKYKVVTSLDKVGKNDHVMIIADKVVNTKTGDALGWGSTPGQMTAVEAGTIGKNGAGGFNETALHEIGHNLGLDHSNGG